MAVTSKQPNLVLFANEKEESILEGVGQTSGLHHFGFRFWSKTWQIKIWEEKIFLTEYVPMITGVENTENDKITYVGYDFIVGVAIIIPMIHLDMTYVNIQ